MSIRTRIAELREEIPSCVDILVATKTRTVSQVQECISAGIKFFGENYVQEAEEKYSLIDRNEEELWFIGHLQKGKINRALRIFDVINIDSFEIAEAISKRAERKVKLTVEVNISGEEQKFGCKPEDVKKLVNKISGLDNVSVIGLMAMAPYFSDAERTRPYFKKMKDIFDSVKSETLSILSIGMSGDYKIAISEGSNMIRVGSVIFK